MNCQKARRRLLLSDAGDLPAADRDKLRAHLDRCSDCRRYEASLLALRGQYATNKKNIPATPPPTLEAIMAVARGTPESDGKSTIGGCRTPVSLAVPWLIAVASLLWIAVIGVVLIQRQRTVADSSAMMGSRMEQRIIKAVAEVEEQWWTFESELAIAALEIQDWLRTMEEHEGNEPITASKGDPGS